MSEMESWRALQADALAFRNARDWEQFHNAKDLALGLMVEAGELGELFLWKQPEEADLSKVSDELADVLIFALLMADRLDLDIPTIVRSKLKRNAKKYPVDKARGSNKKYTELK